MKSFEIVGDLLNINKLGSEIEAYMYMNNVKNRVIRRLVDSIDELLVLYVSYGKKFETLLKVNIDIKEDEIYVEVINDNEKHDFLAADSGIDKLSSRTIKKHIDQITYSYEDGHNKVTLVKEI